MLGPDHVFRVVVVDNELVQVLLQSQAAGGARDGQVHQVSQFRVLRMVRERALIAIIMLMVKDALNRSEGAAGVVLWVVAVWAEKRQRGMQKAGGGGRFRDGEQAQAGRGVRWHQEGARERVVAVAASLGGR